MGEIQGLRGKCFVREDNPIMNPLVLDLIFDMLEVTPLKSCRQVCSKWKYPATRKMMQKCTISVDAEDLSKLSEIECSMNSYDSKSLFRNFTCDKITHESYPNIWKLLGDHVKSFAVSHWWGDSKDLTLRDYEDLLLRRCPCLEEIVLPSTRNFKKAQNFLLCSTTAEPGETLPKNRRKEINLNLRTIKVIGNARPDVRFWRIVSVSPHLRRLHMECHLVPEFWDSSLYGRTHWVERMSNLMEIEVRSYANEGATTKSVNHFLRTPWNLKYMAYECYDLSDTLLKEASEHLKQTLETMHVTLFNKKYDPWPADHKEDWITSPSLTKLKRFKLEIDEHCEGPIFCRTLVLSMLIPNLETLTLAIYEDGENRSEWEQGLFGTIFNDCMTEELAKAGGTSKGGVTHKEEEEESGKFELDKFRREKFRKLVLPPKMKDTSIIQPILRIYPNLKELTLDCPSPQIVAHVMFYWRRLERLSMTLAVDEEEYLDTNWNLVLTGLQIYDGGIEGQQMIYFNGAAIGNLKCLTSLEIKMVSNGTDVYVDTDSMLLNDAFIYNGLSHLSGAQHISINGQKFSEEAVTYLRSVLLPFCHLNFHRGSITSNSSLIQSTHPPLSPPLPLFYTL